MKHDTATNRPNHDGGKDQFLSKLTKLYSMQPEEILEQLKEDHPNPELEALNILLNLVGTENFDVISRRERVKVVQDQIDYACLMRSFIS